MTLIVCVELDHQFVVNVAVVLVILGMLNVTAQVLPFTDVTGALLHPYPLEVLVNIWSVVHPLGTSFIAIFHVQFIAFELIVFRLTAHVSQFTDVTPLVVGADHPYPLAVLVSTCPVVPVVGTALSSTYFFVVGW